MISKKLSGLPWRNKTHAGADGSWIAGVMIPFPRAGPVDKNPFSEYNKRGQCPIRKGGAMIHVHAGKRREGGK